MAKQIEICTECGEVETYNGICDQCQDLINQDESLHHLEMEWDSMTMPFCDCEDRPCCGCG
jgi:hypothetical protein